MRRPTLMILILLFVVLVVTAVVQITIATRNQPDYPGPTSPGQLPSQSLPVMPDPA